MHVKLSGIVLDPAGAQSLRAELANASNISADAIVAHVKALGGKYAVLEQPYIDKDYSADYQTFYASAFRSYPRHTVRIHIFADNVGASLKSVSQSEAQDKQLNSAYLGFIVVRPLQQGPIGRTVLKFPSAPHGHCIRPAARAKFPVHLLGKELLASGAPFIQQDHKIGACAQAAIWMADRAVHARHRVTRWHSTADITQLATTPTDFQLALELPAGSMGLNPIHMIRALKGMGHQPLSYFFEDKSAAKKKPKDGAKPDGIVPPLPGEVIYRYLDSGLPVILGISIKGMSHAVTAVGTIESTTGICRKGISYDAFIRAFVVHDDQRGPYRYMPLSKADIPHLPHDLLLKHGGKVLVVNDVVSHIFVPLPSKVLLRAENADIVAADFLERHISEVGAKLVEQASELGAKIAISRFYRLVKRKKLIRRTYLTSAARYRHHLAKSGLSDPVKAELTLRTLPHFVWVTELLDPTISKTADDVRLIVGHIVINATSTADPANDMIMAHYPHVVIHSDIDAADNGEQEALILPEDAPYRGRIRGH